jgi:8-oxo-dGTP pyrophosphatase MutT (NUDIX family)
VIHKAGLLAVRDNRILLCRKKHTTALLILPGGRIEPGETALECLHRELKEELGEVESRELTHIGTYSDQAAGDAAEIVIIELFLGRLVGEPAPHSEIKELVWFAASDDTSKLAPSLRNKILPDVIARGFLRA